MPFGYNTPALATIAANATVEAQAASATLTVANLGKIQTNTGAGANVALTLPKASDAAGLAVRAAVLVAQTMQFVPATGGKIYLNGSGVADKYVQIAGVIGNYLEVYSDGVQWLVTQYAGVATKQA